jgi:hypothetical protein
MSTLLWSLAKENPWPGLAVASLNLLVALSLVGLSLLLGVTISLVAWLHALVDREAVPKRKQYMPSASGRTADERSGIAFKGLQRGGRTL